VYCYTHQEQCHPSCHTKAEPTAEAGGHLALAVFLVSLTSLLVVQVVFVALLDAFMFSALFLFLPFSSSLSLLVPLVPWKWPGASGG
jgi:hypothetical protein